MSDGVWSIPSGRASGRYLGHRIFASGLRGRVLACMHKDIASSLEKKKKKKKNRYITIPTLSIHRIEYSFK
jgi:hypothetical protein